MIFFIGLKPNFVQHLNESNTDIPLMDLYLCRLAMLIAISTNLVAIPCRLYFGRTAMSWM